MKKASATLFLVFAMVALIGLTSAPAGAATSSVTCNPAYTAWIGAPGSEGAVCSTTVASAPDPAPVYCSSSYTAWIGAPGSEGATCRGLVASHGNNAGN
ncbi:MAG: hypothetical protein P4L55_10055 [Syntrophobacteraceae bacterium]|nr:hypothetical protein [Syntrophobacteraceae bacterium]